MPTEIECTPTYQEKKKYFCSDSSNEPEPWKKVLCVHHSVNRKKSIKYNSEQKKNLHTPPAHNGRIDRSNKSKCARMENKQTFILEKHSNKEYKCENTLFTISMMDSTNKNEIDHSGMEWF